MCIGFNENQDDTISNLLNLLAHLFGHIITQNAEVSLKPLPESIKTLLVKHNDISLKIYQEYCKKISVDRPSKVPLPLSDISFQNTANSGLPSSKYVSRSPFAALTGKCDEYERYDLFALIH
jgi:hypothetical protein